VKLNRILCLVLTAVMSVFFCGCNESDIPDDMVLQLNDLNLFVSDQYTYTKVGREYKDFAETCFEDIEIFGAKLCLPMNVSDLPDKFTYIEDNDPHQVYSGFYLAETALYFDGVKAADALILYPTDKKQSEGQIVALYFMAYLIHPHASFKIGGEYGYMTMERAFELLGEGEIMESYMQYMVYDIGNNRVITLAYLSDMEGAEFDSDANIVGLNTLGYMYI